MDDVSTGSNFALGSDVGSIIFSVVCEAVGCMVILLSVDNTAGAGDATEKEENILDWMIELNKKYSHAIPKIAGKK